MTAICEAIRTYGPLAARILFAQLFILSGVGKIGGFAGTAAFMTGVGLPAAKILLVLTIVLEVGGGLLLIVGWQTRWVAAALGGFVFLTAMIFHPFWDSDKAVFLSQLNHFMKNLAIMGGMLYVMAYGAGPLSVDRARGDGETAHGTNAPKKRHG